MPEWSFLPPPPTDASPQGCLSCHWGNKLQEGMCHPQCEERRYLTEDVSSAASAKGCPDGCFLGDSVFCQPLPPPGIEA